MRTAKLHAHLIIYASLMLALSACGGSTGTVKKTLDNPKYTDLSYNDILVIGVAGDYDNRAAFERAMVSRIKAEGATAVAYYTGDGFVVAFDAPARAIACAFEVSDRLERLGLKIRAGIHTGECHVDGDSLSGIAVHIGARVAEFAEAGEVIVSRTVKDLVVGAGYEFTERGMHDLKGVPDKWSLFVAAPGARS